MTFFFFASPSSDKEDCFSLGLVSWIIIGLIIFAISCVCCVVVCCLRNKVSKDMRLCRTFLPKVMGGELDLMRFRGWDRHILTQHVLCFLTKRLSCPFTAGIQVIDDSSSDLIFLRQNCLLILRLGTKGKRRNAAQVSKITLVSSSPDCFL